MILFFFADDTTLSYVKTNFVDLIHNFIGSMVQLLDWCSFNKLDINLGKTKAMFITKKHHIKNEIPKKIIPLLDKSSLAKMWKDLETLAVMNYITPFLLFQYRQAERLNIWTPSEIFKDAVKRHETNEIIELPYQNFIRPCSYYKCIIFVHEIKIVDFLDACILCEG